MQELLRDQAEHFETAGKIRSFLFLDAEHITVEELKTSMMEMATLVGGSPPMGYNRLDECFTYEPELNALILWYNVEGTTKAVIRHVTDSSSLLH